MEHIDFSQARTWISRPRHLHRIGLLSMLLAGICSLPSCAKTPQESLIGRWYNPEMTIRFREDGSVVYTSRAGRGVGRYVYDGTERQLSQTTAERNVTLDVLMNNQRMRLAFRVDFLGTDRLQLQDLVVNSGGGRKLLPKMTVLRRDAAKAAS